MLCGFLLFLWWDISLPARFDWSSVISHRKPHVDLLPSLFAFPGWLIAFFAVYPVLVTRILIPLIPPFLSILIVFLFFCLTELYFLSFCLSFYWHCFSSFLPSNGMIAPWFLSSELWISPTDLSFQLWLQQIYLCPPSFFCPVVTKHICFALSTMLYPVHLPPISLFPRHPRTLMLNWNLPWPWLPFFGVIVVCSLLISWVSE